jgi:hypothetical protein
MIEDISQEPPLTLKMVFANGFSFALFADQQVVDEMVSHPKFMKMKDDGNDVFVSIEDVLAFEIANYRKPQTAQPTEITQVDAQDLQPPQN